MKNNLIALIMLVATTMSATAQPGLLPLLNPTPPTEGHIQLAILLDTSSSMDGLIDQAKSRLWNIVNTLTSLKYNGKEPDIEIALYEYGNSRLSPSEGYILQVIPFTRDLDLVSEKLFGLRTGGGDEFCGQVIRVATKKLDWTSNAASMKLVYIAGNEPFTQGPVSYKEACSEAVNKQIFINSIHCGGWDEGVRGMWKDGADVGKGKHFNIDSNQKVRYVATPYDEPISHCNTKLNDTYIGYGSQGYSKKENQAMQDSNAGSISQANATERAVSKSGKAYKNDSWDLVDKVNNDEKALEEMKQEDLPKELKGKSKEEIKKVVSEKAADREKLQKEIAELAKKRQSFIDAELAKEGPTDQDDFGNAVKKSILDLADVKGFKQN